VYDEDPGLGFGRGYGSDENEPFDLLGVGRTPTSTEQVDASYEAAMAAGGRAALGELTEPGFAASPLAAEAWRGAAALPRGR
jgi:hypothetical protein